jgi:hypothetical protein
VLGIPLIDSGKDRKGRKEMKKGLFVSVFVLLVTVAFADEGLDVYTNEGIYRCEYTALAIYDMEEQISNHSRNFESGWSSWRPVRKLTIEQEECVLRVLGLYKTHRGDAFRIKILEMEKPPQTRKVVQFYCKFISDTQYQWCAFGNGR